MRARWSVALAGVLMALGAAWVHADVRVIVGPTPILNGSAQAAGDITVVNEDLAFALAVESPVPYGVPRGALVDLAPVSDGKIGRDRVVFADFIPNQWSAWPNTYQHVDVVERGPDRAVVRATRDFGKVVITTTYTLAAHSDHIEIRTTMQNGGDAAIPDLVSGFTLWPNSGFLFAVPGMEGIAEGRSEAALAERVVAYDVDWAVALHASYFDRVGDESMDLYARHSLGPGASRTFDGWLQVLASGDLAPVVRDEIAHRHLAAGTVRGTVRRRDATAIDIPVVVVEKSGRPYAWVIGHAGTYQITLPAGAYELYATAKQHSQSRKTGLTVTAGSAEVRDFRDLDGPGRVRFTVTDAHGGKPLDARIAIKEGPQSPVQFLGRRTLFTEFEQPGILDAALAPGKYVLDVSSGGGFLGPNRTIDLTVATGRAQAALIELQRLFDPPAAGWYSADLHHHADQAEAVTPPLDLARSQLAAGLDLLFVSDHDSTVNHRALEDIAARRGIPFIAAAEFSPSWGHFNAYPLDPGQPLAVDTGVASVQEVFREARRLGAMIVQANHPFIPYGYLTSVAAGVAPGGFDPSFDLLEINAEAPADDDKVLHALWTFWNQGHRYYLSAGTDAHDVWKSESGRIRAFAHIEGVPSARAFSASLRSGHAYVTRGPLIFPSVMFGDELRVRPQAPFNLRFDLKATRGLRRVQLIAGGTVLDIRSFADERESHVDFPLRTARSTWYSLIVEDAAGGKAYTDPIWVDVVDYH